MPTPTSALSWSPDILPGIEATTLSFPADYDGPVTATLARRKASAPTGRALLVVHGFVDYFFHAHFADQVNAHGYDFYALDLRKYGRSLNNAKHPNFCKDVREYYPEINAAIDIIESDGHTFLALNGHSTGGLTSALYAAEGPARSKIHALFLNSPFLAFNVSGALKLVPAIFGLIGKFAPFVSLKGAVPPYYVESIHKKYRGEWDFDLSLKPREGFPAYMGWINAIRTAQARLRRGLSIDCPVLVMRSDKSVDGSKWSEALRTGDAVLNVDHMREGSRHLGPNAEVVTIKDGLHDLTLSRSDVREQVFAQLFTWLHPLTQPDVSKQ
jgi:alpha-beta hydrolase superfamily lysophospholipase